MCSKYGVRPYLLLRLQPFVIFSCIQGPLVIKIDELLKTATPRPEFDVHAVRDTIFYYKLMILFINICVKREKDERKY